MSKGFFLTIEGGDGSGKSSNISYIEEYLNSVGVECILTREPGGTPLAEEIRAILLANRDEPFNDMAELLLMQAARAQHVDQVIKPALAAGKWVVCDRYYNSTIAYQGGARGIDMDRINQSIDIAVQGCHPDMTIYLDIDPEIGSLRTSSRSGKYDRLDAEEIDFHSKVRQSFLHQAEENSDIFRVINAEQSLDKVQFAIKKLLIEEIKALRNVERKTDLSYG